MALDPIGIGLIGAGIGGSLIGGKKKSVDLTPYYTTVKEKAGKQRNLITQQFEELQPLSAQYKQQAQGLGTGIETKLGDIAQQYKMGLGDVGKLEQQNLENILSSRQQQTARNIPLQQQLIREQLAASGGLRTGAAGRALQTPISQAQMEQADLASQLSSERLAREAGRLEKGTDTQMELAKQGALQKLGIDEDTMNTLFQTGRTDIIDRLAALRGVEQDELQSLLGILGIQTQSDLASQASSQANRQALLNSLIGLGGQMIGKRSVE